MSAKDPVDTDRAWSYADALHAIWARSDFERGRVANPFVDAEAGERGLRRVAALLDRLGCPQDRFAAVHIAGSKGKGSTAAILAAILGAAGHRPGLFTSPHLHTVRERIVVAGEAISEERFAALTARVEQAAAALERDHPALGPISTFEILTALALLAFADAGCPLAVIEVGLGGTYDATNVLSPLVAVITRLDLEHTAILGDSLAAIAAAKAGIIKSGQTVLVAPQSAAALAVIAAVATDRGSPLLVGDRDWRLAGDWRNFTAIGPWGRLSCMRLALSGAHQMENAGLALAAVWALRQAGWVIPEVAIRTGLTDVRWPGRFERVVRAGQPTFVLDGAHTPAAAAALAETLATEMPGQQAVLVLGVSADKDLAALLHPLAPIISAVIATQADHPRALPAAALAAHLDCGDHPLAVVPAVGAALTEAASRAGPAGMVLVTGSLFVVASAREALGLAVAEPTLA